MAVSPLPVLMENQIEAPQKTWQQRDISNSITKEHRSYILLALEQDRLDLILVTPKILFSQDIQSHASSIFRY